MSDHDGTTAVGHKVGGESGGGAGDDDGVHPIGARAEGAPEPGGSEGQPAGERIGELSGRIPVSLGCCGEEVLQLDAARVIGVFITPELRALAE